MSYTTDQWDPTSRSPDAEVPLTLEDRLVRWLARQPVLKLGMFFGSLNGGQPGFESDLDLAVMGERSLTAAEKIACIQELARLTGRPVDLIDLQTTRGPILQQILQTGSLLYCVDESLYAELIKRQVYDAADLIPYRERILAERRRAWIGR